jgi:hypothetical protein
MCSFTYIMRFFFIYLFLKPVIYWNKKQNKNEIFTIIYQDAVLIILTFIIIVIIKFMLSIYNCAK